MLTRALAFFLALVRRHPKKLLLTAAVTGTLSTENIMKKALAALLALLSGCASVTQTLDPKVFYKRDLQISMDGRTGDGVLVADAAVAGIKKTFQVTSRSTMELFTFNTCHREVQSSPNAKVLGKEPFFTPVGGLEDQPGCALDLAAYDVDGQHGWGFADFQDARTNLPHTLKCNGEVTTSKGVSVCQSRKELTQRIEFDTPVVVEAMQGCPLLVAADRMNFEFQLGRGKCLYRFREIADTRRDARLTTFGYESIRVGGK